MNLRIHGDNILECEHALRVIQEALSKRQTVRSRRVDGPLWAPKYVLSSQSGDTEVQLFPGYGRWPYDIQKELNRRGAPLREMADAVVTKLETSRNGVCEEPLLAFEFCGALPAGNQAWQRCGRSLNAAYPKIPYFYFAELGGVELDANRRIKAGRLPNPIIPFAYLALGDAMSTIALPVFEPSPSIQDGARDTFGCAFGGEAAINLLSAILAGGYNAGEERELREKAIRASAVLANLRRRQDTLSGDGWAGLANQASGSEKAGWLLRKAMSWRKTVIIPVTTTFRSLLTSVQRMAVAIGTEELPICLLSRGERNRLAVLLTKLYGNRVGANLVSWLRTSKKPLAIVWLAGFKPRGDDSRPDRGLVPLARMIFGEHDVDVLSVVYGPGRNLQEVINNPTRAADTNGLWEAILRFSNGVLIDSLNGRSLPTNSILVPERVQARTTTKPSTPAGTDVPTEFGENDVDTLLHLIFAHELCTSCFECMCNPPGGDWSGLSFKVNGDTFRWTSLPRVTTEGHKRPDHVVQFNPPNALILAIESKDKASAVESGIGPQLEGYVAALLRHAPNIVRDTKTNSWKPAAHPQVTAAENVVSAAAFHYRNKGEIAEVEAKAQADLILGFEFDGTQGRTVVHVKSDRELRWLVTLVQNVSAKMPRRLIVQVH